MTDGRPTADPIADAAATAFVEALGVLLGGMPSAPEDSDPRSRPVHGPAAHSDPAECRACPVCRLLAVLRQARPEVARHLVAAGEELLAAARAFAASHPSADPSADPASTPSAGSGDPAPAEGEDGEGPARPPRRVQRIEIEDGDAGR